MELQAEVRKDGEPLSLERSKKRVKSFFYLTEQTREPGPATPAPSHLCDWLLPALAFHLSAPQTSPRGPLLAFSPFPFPGRQCLLLVKLIGFELSRL